MCVYTYTVFKRCIYIFALKFEDVHLSKHAGYVGLRDGHSLLCIIIYRCLYQSQPLPVEANAACAQLLVVI